HRFPDHDGIMRVSDAGQQRRIHSEEKIRLESDDWPVSGRDSCGSHCGLYRQEPGSLLRAMACRICCGLHSDLNAAFGDGGAESGGCQTSCVDPKSDLKGSLL